MVKTIENYMEEFKKKKKTNKQTLHLERYYYILRTKEKKNTNAIYNLIHTHTHTYIYIYISSLLTYIMRGLLLNYLLTMLTLKSI